MPAHACTRRRFLQDSVRAGASLSVAASLVSSNRVLGANSRLNVGVIGVGGRGAANLAEMKDENVVALCDVDETRLGKALKEFPAAQKFTDYRDLLEMRELDAVVIATPDHHHAPATVRALRSGLHVYCEKPLTHTVAEARLIGGLARELKVATQMGTQNHQAPGYLQTVELLQTGAIGSVREVHVITDRPGTFWEQGLTRPEESPPVPAELHWDTWLGPAAERAYHPAYVPFHWRGWWDFGCGAIGDMAIHLLDPAFWALDLSGPVTVRAMGSPAQPESGPTWMVVSYEFGQRGNLPPCQVYWYEGHAQPPLDIAKDLPMNGSLFVGDEGRLAVQHDEDPVLLPEEKFQNYKMPEPYLPRSPGHHRQWLEACKTGSATGSNFDYASRLTELVLLGNVAYRAGETIRWDDVAGQITPKTADRFLSKEYRKGWEL